jgi:hypothetical protein
VASFRNLARRVRTSPNNKARKVQSFLAGASRFRPQGIPDGRLARLLRLVTWVLGAVLFPDRGADRELEKFTGILEPEFFFEMSLVCLDSLHADVQVFSDLPR